jgi:hypothetical protein
MSETKLGPIPDSHFENDVAPPGTYAGRWSLAQRIKFAVDTLRLLTCVVEPARRAQRNLN